MLDQLRTALRTFSPPMTPPVGGTPRTRSIDGSADPSLRPNLALLEAADIPKEKRKVVQTTLNYSPIVCTQSSATMAGKSEEEETSTEN